MLVLTRKVEECVVVGDPDTCQPLLSIKVLEIAGGKVRLGFQAAATILVHRWEVWQRIHADDAPADPAASPAPPVAG